MQRPALLQQSGWFNRTVIGFGFASLFSDWSHETATTVMPAFLAGLGVSAAWLGLIEGVSDGVSGFAKIASGYYSDKLQRRKPVAVVGYILTATGTASFGLASAAWHVLVSRAFAWLGRGIRTPIRKALLAGAVTKDSYGRAFGFERMMDSLGAIAGPLSALLLLPVLDYHYSTLFLLTLIPSLTAAALVGWIVKEEKREPVAYVSFRQGLRELPVIYRRFLWAVGLFGLGAFAHPLLILLATQKLTPILGATKAASVAIGLYVLHNVFYALFALIGGWLGDKFSRTALLAAGYFMAAVMAFCIMFLSASTTMFTVVFILGGINMALAETLEDSICAELTEESKRGMAFGILATVNGVGDILSSIFVGLLWSYFGTGVAFGYSAVLSMAGAWLIFRMRTPRQGLGGSHSQASA